MYVCERVCQCVLVRKGKERKGQGKGDNRREEIGERKQELYCKSSTTVPTVTSHRCRKVTSDKDDKTNDTCDVCISRSSRTRHSDQIAQREEHLGSRGSGLVSVMSIITPIHSSSIHPIHPFLSIHSIHSYPPFWYNCTIAYSFLYLLHEFHRTGTSSDSSRLYFLYKYTYIHAAAAIGSQPSVIVGGYWLSHRLSGSGWAGQYDNRTGRLSPLILILLFSLRSLSCRSLSCQSLDDNQER